MFSSTWLKDTFERVFATFAEVALGVWIAADGLDLFNLDVAEGAAVAGIAAGAAVLKAAIAAKVGHTGASLSPDLKTVDVGPKPGA